MKGIRAAEIRIHPQSRQTVCNSYEPQNLEPIEMKQDNPVK